MQSLLKGAAIGVAFLAAVFGCAGGGHGSPALPVQGDEISGMAQAWSPEDAGRYLWGYYLVSIDRESLAAEVVPIRAASGHWNILQFLEQGPCTTCFKLKGVTLNPDGTLNVNVSITHPFSKLNLTGFDVRGIPMFNGSHEFPESGLVTSDRTLGEGQVVNADGFTTLYNPTTEGHGFEGYHKGHLATVAAPSSTLNGFKRFVTDDPANTRNAFYAGNEEIVTFQVDMPNAPNPWVFGYAVDASWAPPIHKPVTDPMTDFGPEANCPEPWKMDVQDLGPGLDAGGGTTNLQIDVYDRGGKTTYDAPVVECPDLFNDTLTATWVQDGTGYSRYQATISNSKLAAEGAYACLISAEANENNPSAKPWLDLTAYRLVLLSVGEPSSSGNLLWAKRAGGVLGDIGFAVTTLSDNSTVMTGIFLGSSTFGPGEANQTVLTATGGEDLFVAKYNPDGTLAWAKKAGGDYNDEGYGIAALSDNSTVVTGFYNDSAIFGQGEPNATTLNSAGINDIFVAKYNPNGTLAWAKSAGGGMPEQGYGVTALSDNTTVVTGVFGGSATFGKGESNSTKLNASGTSDVFVARYNTNGTLAWAKRAGGGDADVGNSVAALSDNTTVVTGIFAASATFGQGEPNSTTLSSAGVRDAFVARYNANGTLAWAKRAGGASDDYAYAIAALSDNSTVVTGYFTVSATFGPGEANQKVLTAAGAEDVFIARYNSNGSLAWAKSAGGALMEFARAVTALSDNSTIVTGRFADSATFGAGETNETVLSVAGINDLFMARYNADGTLAWAKRAGGKGQDQANGVTALTDNSSVVTGYFEGSATFGQGEPGQTVLTTAGSLDIFIARFLQ